MEYKYINTISSATKYNTYIHSKLYNDIDESRLPIKHGDHCSCMSCIMVRHLYNSAEKRREGYVVTEMIEEAQSHTKHEDINEIPKTRKIRL